MDFLLILKLKLYIFKNELLCLQKESRLKVWFIVFFILAYGVGSFLLLLHGIDFINQEMGFGYFLIDRLFYIFFMVLFFMLVTSQIIITYSVFFKNREVEFIFTMPIRHTSVYVVKFLESTFLSSWAFAFLSMPIFLAYGVSRSLGLYFYSAGLILSFLFIFISAAIGTGIGVLFLRYFPRKFFKIIISVMIIIGSVLFVYYRKIRQSFNWQSGDLGLVIDQLLKHTNISLYPLLPSYWMSKSLLCVVSKDWTEFAFYFLILLSSAMFFVLVSINLGQKLYFSSWQNIKAKSKSSIYKPFFCGDFLERFKAWVILRKDIRLFFRDPAQWSQFAIFFGMMAVYILNLRSLNYDIELPFWKNLISFLNAGTIALILGTLCTRFVYPQMSLECKRMWIIGLTPVSIGKVMFIKYFFSVVFCFIVTVGLIIGSNIMLKVPSYIFWMSLSTMCLMSICLPGLALGLGAVFPNLKEDDMAKIVSGFGGTLTLIISLAYIIVMLLLQTVPVHLYYTRNIITHSQFLVYISISCFVCFCISIGALVIPFTWGYRRLNRLEV
jgi:ABC-2 type transport system permease protein